MGMAVDRRWLSYPADCFRMLGGVVQFAVRIADDRFAVGIHSAASATLFCLHARLAVPDTIPQTEKGEKHQEQKRNCYQKSISTGEERLSRQRCLRMA